MKINVIGIDLGKPSFHIFGVDEQGQPVVQKKLSRRKRQEFMLKLEPCLVGMEACGGAHHWARLLSDYGHEVRPATPGLGLTICL